ncbi:hypothetical protein EMCRGX_G016499 [Ephydatia muelleri]
MQLIRLPDNPQGMQVTTLRSLQANWSLRPCEAFKQTGFYAGSIENGTCENYFQQPFMQWYAGSIDVLWTLRSLLASLLYAGYGPAKSSSKLVVCRLRPCEAFKQTGRKQVRSLKQTGSYAGFIEDGTCENYFQQPFTLWYAGSIDVLWTLRSLLASLLYAGYDPAKPSSKLVVCRLQPCEAFKQTGFYAGSIEDGTCENYFQQPFMQCSFTFMKVCRVHRCFMDPAKPSSKPVVSRLRPCEAFKQTGSYAGSIEDGTCENYFQQPFTLWYAGSIDVLWTLRSLLATLLYAGYDPAKSSSKLVVCRLRPCEVFKQTGRMQATTLRSLQANCRKQVTTLRSLQANRVVPLKMEPATTTSSNHLCYGMQVMALRCLQANWSYAGFDPAKSSSKLVVMTLRSLQANRRKKVTPCEAFKQTGSYAGSIEDGTCENYFQQPFTLWYAGSIDVLWTLRSLLASLLYAGYGPAKSSSKLVVMTLRSLQANRCKEVRPAKPSSKPGRMQVPLKMEPAKTTSSNHLRYAAFQHGFKIIPVIQGLISSQDKSESFARNLASVQGVGRHSLDSAKICSNSFSKVCRVHRCFMDPAKPSSKPVVCRLLPCEVFKQTGFMQVMTLRSLQANRRKEVTTLRSLQANRVGDEDPGDQDPSNERPSSGFVRAVSSSVAVYYAPLGH